MKYKLKDLCSITKGAIGIMKADGGKYPLVALSDERRNHSEYQFDAKAVIVPLISSTGHGHASMKRVHYQEGKFALGNILCAVIPNDEKQLHPKYLHLYLQQFKETLLVPLMKGAANVSLPMNKLANVEIEVPSLERQLKIIELEEEAAEYKNDLEERLIAQDGDVTKLRQAILREALQGKLVKQSKNEGNGFELLSKIRSERGTFLTGKKGKKEIVQEVKNEEVLFQIPESWAWCRLGEVTEILNGRAYKASELLQKGTPVLRVGNIFTSDRWYYSDLKLDENKYCDKGDLLYAWSASFGPKIWDGGKVIYHYHIWKIDHSKQIDKKFLYYYLLFDTEMIKSNSRGVFMLHMTKERMEKRLLPLPPFAEQNRIVKRIEQFMQLCDELQYSIQQSKIENEKLLQGALRDALKKKEEAKNISLPVLQPMEEKHFLKRKVLATYIINQSLNDNYFGDVKFEKILHLSDYFAIKRNLGQKYYQQAAGPYDNAFTIQYFPQVINAKWFNRSKIGKQFVFSAGQQHPKSTNTYDFFSKEELQRVDEIITYFKKYDYEQPEIVSTLYAVWNNRIIQQEQITNELLIEDFYNWDEQKKRYERNRLEKALEWMRNKNFIPDGWGQVIKKAKKKSSK